MKTRYLLLVSMLFVFIFDMNAQFKIDAQYRVRGQVLHGYRTPIAKDIDAAVHVGQRTRLNLHYNNEKFSTLLSMQDVRTWGDANVVNATGVQGKSYSNTDIYEAWINYKFNPRSSIKLGRQEMKYDDQRHISWRNWWDTGLAFDAVTFTHNNKETGWRYDLSASYNSRDSFKEITGNNYSDGTDYFGSVNPIQTQNFFYLKKNFENKMYLSLLAIATGYQREGTSNTIYVTGTEGLHFNYNATKKGTDGLFGIANVFIQNGKNITGNKISANMYTAQLGYRTMSKKLEISAKIEHLSGQDAKNTDSDYNDTDHTYNLLYGARHPYYEGYLDWFVLPRSTKFGGLNNINVKVSYKASPKDKLMLEYSNISLATNVFEEVVGTVPTYYDKPLASTLDFTFLRQVSKVIKWRSGISYGIPTSDFNKMRGITDGGTNYFIYSMITVSPKFFDSSQK